LPWLGFNQKPRHRTVDHSKRHIDQPSKFLPLKQLALSPHCGFGGIDSKVLSEDEMWKKLDTIVETASQVWS
jgi:methionine synthase II (cobalamin-independent)